MCGMTYDAIVSCTTGTYSCVNVMRNLIFILVLVLSGCNASVTVKAPISLHSDILIKLLACDFVTKPIGNGEFLVKWSCPWQE